VSKRCVDKPPLSFTGPDGPTIPDPSVPSLPVPLKVSDVSGFEVNSMPVMRTQDRDACVWTSFGLSNMVHGPLTFHCYPILEILLLSRYGHGERQNEKQRKRFLHLAILRFDPAFVD
jgi:hypothetical protein